MIEEGKQQAYTLMFTYSTVMFSILFAALAYSNIEYV